MRIALVSPYDLSVAGGVQVHVESLASALRTRGAEVHVIGPGPGESGSDRTVLGRSYSVPANGSRAPISLDPRIVGRVRAALARFAPDVIHVHEPLVPLVGPSTMLTARAPVVATFHASAEGGALPGLYRAVRRPSRAIVARAAALTAVSPVAAEFHARALGIDGREILIVPNGVDVARFAARRRVHARSEVRRIVFLGRLEHRKGADVAVRAFIDLAAARPEVALRVLGDGPQAAALRALIASAPASVRARIDLVGRVSGDELPELLADADIALLPSRGGESFGLVLLEAMASGTVIVATDIPGYRAVARHDREALLVRPDDAPALAGAVDRLIADMALRERLRNAGHERAAGFDWSRIAERMEGVYDRVAEG
jgi:phosphatidylinositol alpha-mannosyltransferase